jgi:hypothetical protein
VGGSRGRFRSRRARLPRRLATPRLTRP